MNETALTEEAIRAVLTEIIDPEVGVNIVDLGLIYQIHILDKRRVSVEMTMTSPACPLSAYLMDSVKMMLLQRLKQLDSVAVQLVWEPPWTPAMMSEAAKEQLGW